MIELPLPPFQSRRTWRNVLNNQRITPLRYFQPIDLLELKTIVRTAEAEGLRVRAVGSGHSFSKVALTDGYMVDPHKLNLVLPVETEKLKPEHQNRNLVFTEAGVKLSDLNKNLDWGFELSLSCLGTIAWQTISGAIATGTHGTGWDMPSIPDMVRSMTMVSSGGKVYQIEPTDGITDPTKFDSPDVELIQDDQWFYSSVVSMGAMGIVYSYIIEAEPLFWLNEMKTKIDTWEEVEADVESGHIFRSARHVSIRVNPYARKQKGKGFAHSVQAIKMDVVPPFAQFHNNINQRLRNLNTYAANIVPGLTNLLVHFQNSFPATIPGTIESTMNASQDKIYKNVSYKVFNQDLRQVQKHGLSSEWAFSVESGNHVKAVREGFKIAEKAKEQGKLYQNSPISLRVSPPSPHYLSTSHSERMIYVEFPMVTGTKGAEEMLDRYQEAMVDLKGKPHWGKFHNRLLSAEEMIRPLYDKWDDWCRIFLKLNPIGTFDNEFTDRMGFRRSGAALEAADRALTTGSTPGSEPSASR